MAFDDPFNTSGDNIDQSNNFYNFHDEDPAAEFLEREKRELGDITGNSDGNSFDDPFNSQSTHNNQLLANGNDHDYLFFLFLWFNLGSHSPAGSNSPIPSNGSQYQALSQLNEPETIRKWREEFAARIEKKDSEEEIKRKELREQAKKELDDFHKQRIEQLERTKGQNRSNNHTLEDDLFKNGTSSNGKVNDWDKITSLCEFNPKNNRSQKDLTRYRSVLLQLKQQQQTSGK
jgi:hypothetical protein